MAEKAGTEISGLNLVEVNSPKSQVKFHLRRLSSNEYVCTSDRPIASASIDLK